jgi:hypothetical protein
VFRTVRQRLFSLWQFKKWALIDMGVYTKIQNSRIPIHIPLLWFSDKTQPEQTWRMGAAGIEFHVSLGYHSVSLSTIP